MANATLLYAHLCDNVFVSEGGKLNMIGVFAGVNNPGTVGMTQFPSTYPRLALAVGLATTRKELPIEVTFRTAKGVDVVPPFDGTVSIERTGGKAEAANVNFNLNFDTFQVTEPGKLFLTLEVAGSELAEIELNVQQATPPEPPAAS